jgi:outer membrane protein assembly factor BamD (BamD/ComL family)
LQKNNDMAENEWFEKAWECMDKEDYAQAKEYF